MIRYLLLVMLLSANYAVANMRAAERIVFAPTSFITVTGADIRQSLAVQSERLVVDCSYTDCEVNAVYRIYAKQDEPNLHFEFLLAVDSPYAKRIALDLLVNINGQASKADIMPAEPYIDETNDLSAMAEKAIFTGKLKQGDNFIQVTYKQNLTLLERDYGYITHSRFVERFAYLLGPLKEWTLAKDFTLDVVISSPRLRPDRDGWSIFRSRTMKCSLPDGVLSKKYGKFIYTYHLNKDFPDVLSCTMGDSDLIKQ